MLFHVLGPIEVRSNGTLLRIKPGKPTKLLATLLLHRNTWVSMDRLIDVLWHDRTVPASAAGNVKSYVCGMRHALPEACIDSHAGAYRIRAGLAEVDADHVAESAVDARIALAHHEPGRAVSLLTETLALWRGTPFQDLAEEVRAPETARLDEVRWELRELLAESYRALGRSADAIGLLSAMTCDDPLRENVWARLVTLLHETGRRGAALATYRRARSAIVRDLGIEPGAELAGAHRMVLERA